MPNSRCIETGAREGVYLGSQLPVDAVPGKSGQGRAKPGAALDRYKYILMKLPEMELFSYFFETFFKTCITMLRQWVVKGGAVVKLLLGLEGFSGAVFILF